MRPLHPRRLLIWGAVLLALATSAACARHPGAGISLSDGFRIGLLLPESKTSRYETFDRPLIEARLRALCPRCEVLYQNADQDSAKQQSQAEAMLTQGVRVIILDAVDARAVAGVVAGARAQGVPVVAYDRLASGPVSFYVSFDSRRIGQVQAQSLLDALRGAGDPRRGQIVMINGSPTDPNAGAFKAAAHSVLDGQVLIGREYDTPDWSYDKAQQQMEQAITALGRENIIGVYAANDGTAGGAIAAMRGAGFTRIPPVTGQDAELTAVQRVLAGYQYMTVYKALRTEAETAAEMALAAATGAPFAGRATVTVHNGTVGVPSVLLMPVVVTRDTVKDTIVRDGVYPVAAICTEEFRQACQAVGLSANG
jgi:D-xylose transport system substrate-binding protein